MARTHGAVAEPIGELKFGQVGVANLRLRTLDVPALQAELSAKVSAAPQLFGRAPLVLDFSQLPTLPGAVVARELLDAIRSAGMMPVGLSYGTPENDALARELGLPVFAKFRAAFERAAPAAVVAPDGAAAPSLPASAPQAPVAADSVSMRGAVGLRHAEPVRSGQQVYARASDLTVNAMVGNGAEVIADGSIHVYGTLRGRALAGAVGDTTARIYCQNFQAELISIAGHYKVQEDLPRELFGKPVQAWLKDGRLEFAKLGPH